MPYYQEKKTKQVYKMTLQSFAERDEKDFEYLGENWREAKEKVKSPPKKRVTKRGKK